MEELVDVDALHSFSSSNGWLLPNAAWEIIARSLMREDILAARLACNVWRKDLGACISHATAYPSQLLLPLPVVRSADGNDITGPVAVSTAAPSAGASVVGYDEAAETLAAAAAAAEAALQQESVQGAESKDLHEDFDCSTALQQQRLSSVDGVHSLLDAFPHCDMIYVDVSTHEEQQLAATVINTLAGTSSRASSSSGSSWLAAAATCNKGTSGTSVLQQHSSGSNSSELGSEAAAAAAAAAAAEQAQKQQQQQQQQCAKLPLSMSSSVLSGAAGQQRRRPQLCLDALQRSYHCPANQEYPSSAAAGRGVFRFLSSLPSQLNPAGLASLVSVQLDAFPEAPLQWAVLQRLPCLRELLLPSFRPALPHEHLPALARLTQLEALTVSVQGSITSWRANCASFASLGALAKLRQLSLHAFHCPGTHLASALMRLTRLRELRLSGRVVLEPLEGLSGLTQLQVLELTQDVQYGALCDLAHQLTGLTQLAVGRVTLPQAAAPAVPPAAAAANADHAQPAAAAAAAGAEDDAHGAEDADMPQLIDADAAPAAADGAAGAVVVAADGGGAVAAAAAAAAGAADGGGGAAGEVMLEDVGAIVDGLIGNLQEGAVPVHLQRIIERFESIIQLDLTRRQHSTPWGWPVPGLALLDELGSTAGSTRCTAAGSTAGSTAGASSCRQPGCRNGAAASSIDGCGVCEAGSSWCGSSTASLELSLLRPADVVRLHELPSQLRACRHLGLRLRDQLLAFASVCPVRLAVGQLTGLGTAFRQLSSLSLCGKVALDGWALVDLAQGLQQCGAAAAAGCGSGSKLAQGLTQAEPRAAAAEAADSLQVHQSGEQQLPRVGAPLPAVASRGVGCGARLVCFSLDCHFVAVSSEQMQEALHCLHGLKVLCLRHRGGGKLPLAVSALPSSLTTLALKKVLLYHQHDSSSSSSSSAAQGLTHQQQQQLSLVSDLSDELESEHAVDCHAITSPGFRRAVARGFSRPPSPADEDTSSQLPAATGGFDNDSAAAEGAAGGSSSSGGLAMLPHLKSLFLKNCLISGETLQLLLGLPGASSSSSSSVVGGAFASQLVRLSVTGDQAGLGEVCEAWPEWVGAIRQLTGLQVLDIAVPEDNECSLPPDLLQALQDLPRLNHLHITTHHAPQQLLGLTTLAGRLKTLNVNYTGPPTLPNHLLTQLREGLGFNCRVQVWENVVLPSCGSFGEGSGGGVGGVGADGAEGVGRQRKGYGRLREVALGLKLGAVVAGGWWCGWVLGGALGGWRQPRRRQQGRRKG